ncbi:MAG TPA: hypothetical protein EYP04_05735 [Anaerolineae bacterium]|nr:hypothetical protein [Anaerolineae bacterium]
MDEEIIRQQAAVRGIAVSDAEVEAELRQEIANSKGFVTEAQATATATAGVAATATAAVSTPTPTPTSVLTNTEGITETASVTPEPTPTVHIITDAEFQQEYRRWIDNIAKQKGLTEAEFRELIRTQLLRQKLEEAIGQEVPTTEEQVHVRHILIAIRTPQPTPTPVPEGTPTPVPLPTPEVRTQEEALALALQARQRILNGEDFAEVAAELSDDPGSKDNGGDLGWFGRGRMVKPFEDAAFSLEVGEISEPVLTDYGYHIIEVLEKDPARPLSEYEIQQRRQQAFQEWFDKMKSETPIERFWSSDKLPQIKATRQPVPPAGG